jgi:hypothetical protein
VSGQPVHLVHEQRGMRRGFGLLRRHVPERHVLLFFGLPWFERGGRLCRPSLRRVHQKLAVRLETSVLRRRNLQNGRSLPVTAPQLERMNACHLA